jgi:hypothetical protein
VITASGDALHSNTIEGNQWYDENGLIPGATGQNFLALEPGTYYVIVTSGDCVSAPSNAIELLSVSANEAEANARFKIYPNPAGDELYVEAIDPSEQVSYAIIHMYGQSIRKGTISPTSKIALEGLIPGLYIVRLESYGILTRVPFVKQ